MTIFDRNQKQNKKGRPQTPPVKPYVNERINANLDLNMETWQKARSLNRKMVVDKRMDRINNVLFQFGWVIIVVLVLVFGSTFIYSKRDNIKTFITSAVAQVINVDEATTAENISDPIVEPTAGPVADPIADPVAPATVIPVATESCEELSISSTKTGDKKYEHKITPSVTQNYSRQCYSITAADKEKWSNLFLASTDNRGKFADAVIEGSNGAFDPQDRDMIISAIENSLDTGIFDLR